MIILSIPIYRLTLLKGIYRNFPAFFCFRFAGWTLEWSLFVQYNEKSGVY